jgi:hypothetical protein
MTEDAYQIYLREHEEEYPRARMITDQESSRMPMLPQGLETPDQFVFVVGGKGSGRMVGYVWFSLRRASRELYLCHILVRRPSVAEGTAGPSWKRWMIRPRNLAAGRSGSTSWHITREPSTSTGRKATCCEYEQAHDPD